MATRHVECSIRKCTVKKSRMSQNSTSVSAVDPCATSRPVIADTTNPLLYTCISACNFCQTDFAIAVVFQFTCRLISAAGVCKPRCRGMWVGRRSNGAISPTYFCFCRNFILVRKFSCTSTKFGAENPHFGGN